MTPDTEPHPPIATARKKPRLSFLLATWFGLGYLPKAPGTWGSLAGVLLTVAAWFLPFLAFGDFSFTASSSFGLFFFLHVYEAWIILLCLFVAGVGVLVSSRVASYVQGKDPQFVVI